MGFINQAEPFWCEGSKIYFFGCGSFPGTHPATELESLFEDPELASGNVLDLSGGVDAILLRREKKYGSSGGIEDDLMKLEGDPNI